MSYDNAKACAVVETTDVIPNLIDVDQKNRQIPTENARNKNIYDSNSKQMNLPGLSIDSPYHSEDSAGKFLYITCTLLSLQLVNYRKNRFPKLSEVHITMNAMQCSCMLQCNMVKTGLVLTAVYILQP